MRGYIYSVPFGGTITNANGNVDLLEVSPGDDEVWALIGLKIGQTSEVGDTQEEGVSISIVRQSGAFTSGSSGGSAPTAAKQLTTQPSHGATLEQMNTTIGSGGTQEEIETIPWNLRGSPLEQRWSPDEAYMFVQGEAGTIRWNTTVADDVSVAGVATFEVIT